MYYTCIRCGRKVYDEKILYYCPFCNDLLDIRSENGKQVVSVDIWETRDLGVWRYRELLPVKDLKSIITLGEGGTPLYRCLNIKKKLGIDDLYVKNEGENPTGSFKDRGMTVAITKVNEIKAETVVCASTGNTSASLAAYAAKSGIKCIIYIPKGNIATGKLVQAIIHGAKIIQLRGNFDDALRKTLKVIEEDQSIILMNSLNPFRIEGQKTLAFEICSQLGYRPPDTVIIPVGNAGNITALMKGFQELKDLDIIETIPKIIGIQAEGAAPIATAFQKGRREIELCENPKTIATAIRIGNPVNWKRALEAAIESGGSLVTVSDEEIIQAQKFLAQYEGIFVEPASASTIAYLTKAREKEEIASDDRIVCITTGHGLKDPDIVLSRFLSKSRNTSRDFL